MITQFQGEDRKDAIVNSLGLDIEEEDFFEYMEAMGYSIDAEDQIIESLYQLFLAKSEIDN
jgi:hypothetical protein